MSSSMLCSFVLIALAASIELSSAATHTVGGRSGWDFGIDYQGWASNNSFHVGDTLVFPYTGGHDVVEVTKSGYDACNSMKLPSMKTYKEANPSVPLTTAGEHFYICSIPGHCTPGGMKLAINVLSTSLTPPAAPAESAGFISASQGASALTVVAVWSMALFFL